MKNVKPGHAHPIVCLDAGHYGKCNRSPVVKGYYESDMTWKLANYEKIELEKYGIVVWLTRSNQAKDMDLISRGKASKGADLFESIHSNASETESVDRPVVIFLVDDNCGTIDDQSRQFAGLMAETVRETMQTNDKAQIYSRLASTDRDGDGRKNDDYYGVLYGAHQVGTPGVITEHSFHTNTRAAKWLLVDENLQKLAKAKAKTIAEYFGMSVDETVAGFTDVPATAWYANSVQWAVSKGITTGVESGKFAPDDICTRAEAVTFLWRSCGKPVPVMAYTPFDDVKPSAWYNDAVCWALGQGITQGTDTHTFSPDAACTRAQVVTMLWRAAGSPEPAGYQPFTDVQPASWYAKAVQWAVDEAITNGTDGSHFSPDEPCTRAEMVTFLHRKYMTK